MCDVKKEARTHPRLGASWHISVTFAVRRPKQKDNEFQVGLGHMAKPSLKKKKEGKEGKGGREEEREEEEARKRGRRERRGGAGRNPMNKWVCSEEQTPG